MEKYKVLIIEDEVKLARFLELELKYEGYEVEVGHNGREGLVKFMEEDFSILLLDLMLPGINGIEICRRIRKKDTTTPIIMLTAKDQIMDKVAGLNSGADDYLTKPFAIEELLARMRVALKRISSKTSQNALLTLGDKIKIDNNAHTVKVNDESVELTKKEYELLVYLIKNKNIVLTREQILNSVWGYDFLGETNIVDVYIRYLRSKIDETLGEKVIHTIRGVGYYVKDED